MEHTNRTTVKNRKKKKKKKANRKNLPCGWDLNLHTPSLELSVLPTRPRQLDSSDFIPTLEILCITTVQREPPSWLLFSFRHC